MNLLKVHYKFLFTKKVLVVMVILLIISYMIILLQSNLLSSLVDLDINRELYIKGYSYDGLNLIKIVTVLFTMLVGIYSFYISKYDVFLISRNSKTRIIISKFLTVSFISIMFSLCLVLFYSVLWVILDINVELIMIVELLLKMSLFSVYYSLLYAFLVINFNNLFIMVMPFMGYLISNLSIDYGVKIDEIERGSRIINVLFPDLIVLDGAFEYIYGSYFVLSVLAIITISTIRRYATHDMVL
ncbi:hypothetical protein KQ51_01428 [Candidatus Izimaplasma bacterium HR1]|uniref:hypothetical protein n=1 Tax=Candidatus Izimoplasma sp. HR1 TaxID=1541959 RepID=UPI0004F7F216|nr:hypothetical protein KQ51_01428 [Candidatus Izimaplasma bacterium HR1]